MRLLEGNVITTHPPILRVASTGIKERKLTLQIVGENARVGYWGLGLLLIASWIGIASVEGFPVLQRDGGLPLLFFALLWSLKLIESSYGSMTRVLKGEVSNGALLRDRFIGRYVWWGGFFTLTSYFVWKLLPIQTGTGVFNPLLFVPRVVVWFFFLLAALDFFTIILTLLAFTPTLSRLAFKLDRDRHEGLKPVGRYAAATLMLYLVVSSVWTGIGGALPNPQLADLAAPWVLGAVAFPAIFFLILFQMGREREATLNRVSGMRDALLGRVWSGGLSVGGEETRVLQLTAYLRARQGESVLDLFREAYSEIKSALDGHRTSLEATARRVIRRILDLFNPLRGGASRSALSEEAKTKKGAQTLIFQPESHRSSSVR